MAIPLDASRPMVISASESGMVESFKGPESTRSLGRKLPTSPALHITVWTQIHSRFDLVPISEQIVTIRSDSDRYRQWDDCKPEKSDMSSTVNALLRVSWKAIQISVQTGIRLAFHMHLGVCGSARQKAMGEALFGIVLAELVQSGIRGAPSSDPSIFERIHCLRHARRGALVRLCRVLSKNS